MNTYLNYGDKLGISQKKLAEYLGVSKATISLSKQCKIFYLFLGDGANENACQGLATIDNV